MESNVVHETCPSPQPSCSGLGKAPSPIGTVCGTSLPSPRSDNGPEEDSIFTQLESTGKNKLKRKKISKVVR